MVKDYRDYLAALQQMYPDLDAQSVEKIVKDGLSSLQDLVRRDHDIRLENTSGVFDRYRLILYRSQQGVEAKKKRYFRNLIRIRKYREDKKLKYAEKLQSK